MDNIEVLFCVSENGKNYFAYGDVPFADFTVADYLKYRRALCKDKAGEECITEFGLKAKRRLRRLNPVQMRVVQFLEKTCGNTDKTVVVNLDGTRYGKRKAARLKRLTDKCRDVYVFVTDERFVKRCIYPHKILTFGKPTRGAARKFYAAKQLAERIGATKISVM